MNKTLIIIISLFCFCVQGFFNAAWAIGANQWEVLDGATFDIKKVQIGNLYYDLSTERKLARVVAGNVGEEDAGLLRIPDKAEYDGASYTVVSIGDVAFRNCTEIAEIVLSDSIREIRYSAFWGCVNLTKIKMPQKILNICNAAFEGCEKLRFVLVPDLAQWCQTFFGYGVGRYVVNDTANPLRYGKLCDAEGHEISELVIPDGVGYITDWAFYGCSNITSVTMPESVTAIGKAAFSGCANLVSVKMPSSVTSVGELLFENCKKLTTVSFPQNIKTIPRNFCKRCTSLSELVIPEGVERIDECAFEESSIEEVSIPRSLKSVGESVFLGCRNIKRVYIPDLETWCSIDFAQGGVPTYPGASFFADGTEVENLLIPDGVTRITPTLFAGYNLHSVDLNDVDTIGNFAFTLCNVETVFFPQEVSLIEKSAFVECEKLSTLYLHDVKKIESGVFSMCPNLKDLYFDTTTLPELEDVYHLFSNSPINAATLHVPEAMIETFSKTAPWSGFGHIVALTPDDMPDGVEQVSAAEPLGPLYDLQGRRLAKQPERGMYIENGRVKMR